MMKWLLRRLFLASGRPVCFLQTETVVQTKRRQEKKLLRLVQTNYTETTLTHERKLNTDDMVWVSDYFPSGKFFLEMVYRGGEGILTGKKYFQKQT